MPEKPKDKTVQFRKYNSKLVLPFVGYADFEVLTGKEMHELEQVTVAVTEGETTMEKEQKKIEREFNTHQVCAYAIIIATEYESLFEAYQGYCKNPQHIRIGNKQFAYLYRGTSSDDTMRQFFEDLMDIQNAVLKALEINIPMIMTKEEMKLYEAADMCHICEEKIQICCDPDGNEYTSLSEIKGDLEKYGKKGEEEDHEMYKIAKKAFKQFKVRDHDHYTGKFRGAAHNSCNMAYNFKNYRLPIFFHNLKGYDEHFIVRMMGKYSMHQVLNEEGELVWVERKMDCIPNTAEKYMNLSYDHI